MSKTAENFDVLIVGGGVIGLSIAWELAQHDAKVCVVDRGSLGKEASWAGAGMIPPGPPPSHWSQATAYEQLEGLSQSLQAQWHKKLLDLTGIDNEYRRCGSLQLALTDQKADILQAKAAHWQSLGIECLPADAALIADLEPALTGSAMQIRCGYVLPEEAQIRNPSHLQALVAACESEGVVLKANTPITSLATENNRILSAATTDTKIHADKFCLATGSWTGQLAKCLNIDLPVKPIRGQIALLKGPAGLLQSNINVGPRYLVSRRDGHLLIGSTQEDVGFEKGTTDQSIEALRRLASTLAPQTSSLPLQTSWSGLRPSTPDGLPLLGRLPEVKNGWIAAGHFRAGLQLSPATAVAMRATIFEQTSPANIDSLSQARFATESACTS